MKVGWGEEAYGVDHPVRQALSTTWWVLNLI